MSACRAAARFLGVLATFTRADSCGSGSGRALSLEGQEMLQKLMHEASERFSRGAKKKAIKGMHPPTNQCDRVFASDTIQRFIWRAVVS